MLGPAADPHACLHLNSGRRLLPRLDERASLPPPAGGLGAVELVDPTGGVSYMEPPAMAVVRDQPIPPPPRAGWLPAPPSRPSPRMGRALPHFSPRMIV